ncbi:ScbR family autoregulator-binding transcription factor [Actinacidiphila soli]|uniref:ScbR family autoregulator-binding transcription factor n=1 Tax=Actinacidiphila soli TaxID=2487275 RepID=UPI0013E2DCD7|nr:ScbR family autoregulator-binding transcription factor [Actinacidiphila soli]
MTKQERAIQTREALRQAAAEIFTREGFPRASLPSISHAAGVSKGALYFHFHSKDDLATAIEEEAEARVELILQRLQAREGVTSLQTVVDATYALMKSVATDAVVRAGFRLGTEVARESSVDLWGRWQAWVHAMLSRAEESAELAPGVSRSAAGAVIVIAVAGMEVLASKNAEWMTPEHLNLLWEVLLPQLEACPVA